MPVFIEVEVSLEERGRSGMVQCEATADLVVQGSVQVQKKGDLHSGGDRR